MDTTRASCQSGGTRIISKVIALSTVRVSGNGFDLDKESAAAVRAFVDGGL